MSITDIAQEHAEESLSDSDDGVPESEFERYDVDDHSYIKVHPTTAVGGTAVCLRRFPGDPQDDDDDGFIGLVVEDPFVKRDDDEIAGTTVFQSDSNPASLKVVNTEDKQTVTEDMPGVVFDGNIFQGHECDTFGDTDDFGTSDRYIIKLTGNAGRSAAQCLDVCGLSPADVERDDNGVPKLNDNGYPYYNGGLVEKYPGNDDDTYIPPRYARDPQLRPDLEGEDVIVMLQYTEDVIEEYSGNSYWATVMVDTDDGRPDVVEPTTEFEADEDLVMDTRWLEWTYPEDERIDEIRDMRGYAE